MLRGVEEKRSSLQSHMNSLQQQMDTYKSMLAEKQQKNEQLHNKLAKVLSCLHAVNILEYYVGEYNRILLFVCLD